MKRPLLVTVMGFLLIIAGLVQAGVGALFIAKRHDATLLTDSKLDTPSKALVAGIAFLVLGLLSILLATGLLKGSRAARGLVGLLQVASIGFAIYTLVTLKGTVQANAAGSIGGSLVVLYFLFGTDKAKAYFAKH